MNILCAFSQRKFILSVFLLFSLCGCAALGTYNPATGRREMILISTPEEIVMGQQVHTELMKSHALSADQALIARVNRIGQRLAIVSDRQDYQYSFYVLEKNELNAFTTPGGHIYIYTGLLARFKTDDEIAAVLAHEIGHCAARHVVKKYQAALGYDLVGSVVLNRLNIGAQAKQVASLTSGALMSLVFSAYSRSDEYQSDLLGLKYLDLAGYDLMGMVRAFEVLEKEGGRGTVPLILRSHPHIDDRIEVIRKEIARMKSSG